jgi:hypothetical protein
MDDLVFFLTCRELLLQYYVGVVLTCTCSACPTGGICGSTVEAEECRSACVAQQWTWNYVSCLEQYYQGAYESCEALQYMSL